MKEFRPEIGLKTSDCYLHGIGVMEDMFDKGVIEHVGIDYFILRNIERNQPIFVSKDSYGVIEESDFN